METPRQQTKLAKLQEMQGENWTVEGVLAHLKGIAVAENLTSNLSDENMASAAYDAMITDPDLENKDQAAINTAAAEALRRIISHGNPL